MSQQSVFDTDRLVHSYFKLALPVVFSMVITLIYNLADTYFIAKTNDAMLVAGVSLCASLFTALMAIGNIGGRSGAEGGGVSSPHRARTPPRPEGTGRRRGRRS